MKNITTIVTATCSTSAQAEELAQQYRSFNGVTKVEVDSFTIRFTCVTAPQDALSTYGRIKDALPYYCHCSVTPFKEKKLAKEAA